MDDGPIGEVLAFSADCVAQDPRQCVPVVVGLQERNRHGIQIKCIIQVIVDPSYRDIDLAPMQLG